MKKAILIILFSIFIFLSCERTDIYDDATSYASIYAWFTPEDAKADASGNVYYWPDKDGRDLFLYNNTVTSQPNKEPSSFNNYTSLYFDTSVRFLQYDYFQLTPPLTILLFSVFTLGLWDLFYLTLQIQRG